MTMRLKNIIKDVDLDIFQKNKLAWLDTLDNEMTKITYYRLIERHVHSIELMYDKDLYDFTATEIKNLMMSLVSNSRDTKKSVYSAINSYITWAVERGFNFVGNPCDSIDPTAEGLYSINVAASKKAYMPLNEFYEWIDGLDATDVDKMIIIMIRYNIAVSEISSIKWEDVNRQDKYVRVQRKDKFVDIPVDDEFIRRVDLAKACQHKPTTSLKSKYVDTYFDAGYIIKSNTGMKKVPSTTLYNTISNVCDNNEIQRVDLSLLSKSRRYDFALNFDKRKILDSNDLRFILKAIGSNSSDNSVTSFKKDLKALFGIEVLKIR